MFDYYHENLVDMSHNNEKHNVKSWRQQKLDSVNDLWDDEHYGVDCGISMNDEALETDLFEHSVQMRRWESENSTGGI